MTEVSQQKRQWLDQLDREMRDEIVIERRAVEDVWQTPLAQRVERGDALGPLRVISKVRDRVLLEPLNQDAELAESNLREGDFVRLSPDKPHAPTGHFIHAGEDERGIHLLRWKGKMPAEDGSHWVIDPDFLDMTSRYAEAIDALATTELGRERVLPLLMDERETSLDGDLQSAILYELEESGPEDPTWHDSQQEAIASCVAAQDLFLVQGPPGTGKTRVLAEVARRLVEKGECIMITGPTHRAINHALAGIRQVLPPASRVVKIGFSPINDPHFESFDDFMSSGLQECDEPYVVGATSHAMWGQRSGLRDAVFDTVLLDEASQLTPLLAAMAMLRGERWLFFGDDCQLPPVVRRSTTTSPRELSVFGKLKNRGADILLEETWRLNEPLAEWPSATFYGNRLICRHDQRLHLVPLPESEELKPDPAAVLQVCPGSGRAKVRANDESQAVADLVREAVESGLKPERIGVITPFRAQAARIRQILRIPTRTTNLQSRVAVDTVERFQGQERDLIVISLASSDPRFIRMRADFLFQAERWNVAMTRARLKTILVVSPQTLDTADSLADDGHEGAICFASLINHLRNHAC